MGTFQASLKKWFYTNNSSAAAIDARVPLLNANGSPKGSDTMANVASVLNGAGTFELLTTRSVSDYYNLNAGWKFCGAGYTGTDLPQKSSCFVEFKKQGTHSGLQILYYVGNVTPTYVRTHSGTSQEASAWSPWQRIDNYGTSSLAELASALGGDSQWLGLFPKRGEVPNNDFNNAIPYGIYYAMNTTDWTNGPVPKDQCIMLCYGWQVNARTIQVAFCVGAVSTSYAGVYIRIYKQGMEPLWSEWVKL